jgi:hypothetical protein
MDCLFFVLLEGSYVLLSTPLSCSLFSSLYAVLVMQGRFGPCFYFCKLAHKICTDKLTRLKRYILVLLDNPILRG